MRIQQSMLLSLVLGSCTVLQPVMAAEPVAATVPPQMQVIGPLYALGPVAPPVAPRTARPSRSRAVTGDRAFAFRPWVNSNGWRDYRFRGHSPYSAYGFRSPPGEPRYRWRPWYGRPDGATSGGYQPRYAGRVITPYGWGRGAPGQLSVYQLRSY